MSRTGWLLWFPRVALGPAMALRARWPAAILGILAAMVLTAVTQIGGLVLWLSWPLLEWVHRRLRGRAGPTAALTTLAAFLLIYMGVGLAIVPPLASAFGRERLPCFAEAGQPLRAVSPFFCLTNRNYARPDLQRMLGDLSAGMAAASPGTVTAYLDAGFPFLDGFPMLPHLSHRYGRDVDLAFFYRWRDGAEPVPSAGSWPVGYWLYVQPRPGDPQPCAVRTVDLRWDWDWLQLVSAGLALDERRTGAMLNWLSDNAARYGIRKILLEPHLQRRLSTDPAVVRFQGCPAARHDDHLHVRMR